MEILNSKAEDINEIFRLYKIASDYMKDRYIVYWPEFARSLVETEIKENRQWKMIIDGQVACVWATTFNDAQIWEERDNDPSVYIHRIATNPNFRGQNFVTKIVAWSKDYAKENKKNYIRLDTVGENKGLIEHYTKCGFDYLGLLKLQNTEGLPAHYNNAAVSLFEIKIQ